MAESEPTDQEFQDALDGEDELGMVVRAHIHVEHELIRVIELLVPHADELKKMNLDYEKRVHLAVALGLKDNHRPPLLALGSIRNHFAHKLRTKVDKNLVNNLYKSFDAKHKETINNVLGVAAKALDEPVPQFRKLEPRVQFIYMVLTLRFMLIAARRKLEKGGNNV